MMALCVGNSRHTIAVLVLAEKFSFLGEVLPGALKKAFQMKSTNSW